MLRFIFFRLLHAIPLLIAVIFVILLMLQLIPYSLAGGAGVTLGFAALTRRGRIVYPGRRVRWLLIPYEALGDACRIYVVSLPLFAIASVFEFVAA